ncbi:MAG: hypothetical protein HUJ25_01320 [Crocinitomicaceae bacterium]|nr:hypothetical protein [Crocinitomicaceae bacterium]
MINRIFLFGLLCFSPLYMKASDPGSGGLKSVTIYYAPATNLVNHVVSGQVFVKHVWSIIDTADVANHPLFFPHNEYPLIRDELRYTGYSKKNLEEHKKVSNYHLWNIILYHFLLNEIEVSLPFDPNWFETQDRGFLLYPLNPEIYGTGTNKSYFTDSVYRSYIHKMEVIGYKDYSSYRVPIQSIQFPGEDSIDVNGNLVYYSRPTYFYEDKDIIAYKIKESWLLDKKTKVKSKKIDAIAPVVNQRNSYHEIVGQKELFWVNFSSLNEKLKEYFIISEKENDKNIISYSEYFEQRKFVATRYAEDSIQVKLKE